MFGDWFKFIVNVVKVVIYGGFVVVVFVVVGYMFFNVMVVLVNKFCGFV